MITSSANDVQYVFTGMQHTKQKLFSHSLKALQSAVTFVSPRHLYTLACRTATLLLQGTIQNNWQQSTVVILTDKNKHVTLASTKHSHFTQIQWKLHDRGLHCDTVSSFDSQIITPTLLFVASHPPPALSLCSLSDDDDDGDDDDDDDDVLWSHSHIKWKPNLVSPFQLTHVFTLEVTWLMRKPQDPHSYNRKSNPSLHTQETFYGKRTIFVVTASVCAAMSAAAFIQLKWASTSLYK